MTRSHLKKLHAGRAAALSPEQRSEIARNAALARAEKLSPERRSEIAGIAGRLGAQARWGGKKRNKQTAA